MHTGVILVIVFGVVSFVVHAFSEANSWTANKKIRVHND